MRRRKDYVNKKFRRGPTHPRVAHSCLSTLASTTTTVKYRQSAPPSRPFVVVLWRWSAVCRSYDTDLVHIFHILQSIRGYPYLRAGTSSTQKPAKCALTGLSTLRFSHRTNFVALCHTIFLSLAVKSRWGALARRGALAVLYGSSTSNRELHCSSRAKAKGVGIVVSLWPMMI